MTTTGAEVHAGEAAEIIERLLVELAGQHSAPDFDGDRRADLLAAGHSFDELLDDDRPEPFARVCARLLDEEHGYPTAMDAANALRAAQAEAGTVGVAPGVWRRRVLALLLVGTGLTIVGVRERNRRRGKRVEKAKARDDK